MKHADLNFPTFILVQYYPPQAKKTMASELLLYRGGDAHWLQLSGVRIRPLARWPWGSIMWGMLRQEMLTG